MNKFLCRMACFGLIQIVIAAIVLPLGESDEYLLAMRDKHELLSEHTRQPRLILVGGSNVAFGIESEELQNELGLAPVNLGLHESAGLSFQLRMIERHVRRGDVIVLLPEYSLLTRKGYEGSAEFKQQLIQNWPQAAAFYKEPRPDTPNSWKEWLDKRGLASLGDRFHWGRKKLARKIRGKRKIYVRSGFNQYGDMVAHYRQPAPGYAVSADLAGGAGEVDPNVVDPNVTEEINAFARQCERLGAQVLLSYPPLPNDLFEVQQVSFKKTHADLSRLLEIAIVGTPGQLTFAPDCFFDSHDYLSKKGVQLRTKMLANGLRSNLGMTAGVRVSRRTIPLPERR